MKPPETVVAVFTAHTDAEDAVKKLAAAGFAMADLSVIGRGYHTEESVVGFYNIGDRIKFWGTRGAAWGGLWGLFFGGLFVSTPVVGPVVLLGFLATAAVSAVEGAVMLGGLGVIGATLYSAGIPKNSVVEYEAAVKADRFLVIARGTAEEIARAKILLGAMKTTRLDHHAGSAVAA